MSDKAKETAELLHTYVVGDRVMWAGVPYGVTGTVTTTFGNGYFSVRWDDVSMDTSHHTTSTYLRRCPDPGE